MSLLTTVFERRAKEIHAELVLLSGIRDWAESAARDAGLPDTACYQVKLALSEAVANAIQHGSTEATDMIRIAAFEEDGSLVFEVRDTGEFVPPLVSPDGEDERGRGLQLLALMMDEVQISSHSGGSLLRFSKRLS